MNVARVILSLALLLSAAVPVRAQDNSAARIHALVHGLTVTPRVLLIGARPTDADADLIAWLARGHYIETGFLSLTRGESFPNYAGLETGATLGAVHVEEALAARRIDGAEQFFTRAFDFGNARTATEAFVLWDHDMLLGDVVTVVRAFRPHVIIALARQDTSDRDAQRQVGAIMARDVFDAAADTARFSTKDFGLPWTPASLYEPGVGVTMDSRDYDRVIGRTYATIATESRSQFRSVGFDSSLWQGPRNTAWQRIATRVAESSINSNTSIFAGVDTSFARLGKDLPYEVVRGTQRPFFSQMPEILANADSARMRLDLANPAAVLSYLKRVSELVSAARASLSGCRHPSRDAAVSLTNRKCQAEWLDLDASLDLMQQRSADALLAASGVSVEAVADREFLASYDTADVVITVSNNGSERVLLNDVSITAGVSVRMLEPIVIPPHSMAQVRRSVTSVAYAHPWWIFQREQNFYPSTMTGRDGVPRPGFSFSQFGIPSITIPENIRRLSDVAATLTIGNTTLTSSMGPVLFRTATPALGVQSRLMSGVPAVTLGFERVLEWAQAGKALKKQVRVTMRSYSDKPRTFALRMPLPGRIKFDSLPASITLAPHESRDITIPIRGTPEVMRYVLYLSGVAPKDTFSVGFRTAQYSYLRPLHLFRETAVSVQSVDIEIPARLNVAYVRGAGDDTDAALKQLGIPAYAFNNEGLSHFDLEGQSTVVIGPDAFRVDPGLLTQMPRLTEFARKGGTLVIMGNPDVIAQTGVLPYPVAFTGRFTEQVTTAGARVAVIDAKAHILTWPNVIRDDDWKNWVSARTTALPTVVDPRYATLIETHDPEQKENRNAILVATVGKGRIIYTSLTLTQQISGGVPGAMRVFVNLLSAGLPMEPAATSRTAPALPLLPSARP